MTIRSVRRRKGRGLSVVLRRSSSMVHLTASIQVSEERWGVREAVREAVKGRGRRAQMIAQMIVGSVSTKMPAPRPHWTSISK